MNEIWLSWYYQGIGDFIQDFGSKNLNVFYRQNNDLIIFYFPKRLKMNWLIVC
ncbi:MAG: hypothetical protein S4CHLAM20_01350 [Chlamydiia bacterium]|nr:hypothetical protein [Chlamydiia bacterium]